jgi:uncharacterized protein YbbC (DUF1343 family)
MKVQNGIDLLLTEDFGLKGRRLGLITGPTGLSGDLVSSIDVLQKRFDLRALYAPEHGVRGDVDAGGRVDTYQDSRTGLPVYSVYGDHRPGTAGNRPVAEMLEDIDMLLMDIQDVGCRFYTFISTMYNAMEVCAETGTGFAVLDRVNPINGADVEGNILDPAFKSFIGIAPIPQRHGMTMGELALFFNTECGIGCDLTIVPVKGWTRELLFDETGLPWVNPSPNIPGLDAALLYPGTCFFEGTTVSEGRGTTKPFEMIGAPWLNAEALAGTLNGLSLPGVLFRPVYFNPWAHKFQGELCQGVQPHLINRREIRPVKTGLSMLKAVMDQGGEKCEWRPPDGACWVIDLLAGTDALRTGEIEAYLEDCETGGREFAERRGPYLLY